MGWNDVGRWLMSPGFGGFAAVLAASLAFWAAQAGRHSADRRAREGRWWEQARWAADLLLQGDDRQALGIAALDQLRPDGGIVTMDSTSRTNGTRRFVSKKEANRAAAARVYVAASKKAGKDVPESVKRLAAQSR